MVAQRTLTPYVEVRILLPLPKKKQAPTGACFFTLLYKGFEPAKVSALRKQFSELFLAESARRVLKFGRISVAEAGSMQGEAAADGRILLPLPKKRQAPTGACFFLFHSLLLFQRLFQLDWLARRLTGAQCVSPSVRDMPIKSNRSRLPRR